jgi:hypothetical protein
MAKVESESTPVFHTLVPFFLFAKEKAVFPVLISIRQRIAVLATWVICSQNGPIENNPSSRLIRANYNR